MFSAGYLWAAEPADRSLEENALKAQVMTTLNGMDAALSALKALRQNDRELAMATLESQLRSDMTKLYAFLPSMGDEDRRLVQEALRDAEQYAKQQNLRLVR